MPHDLKLVPLTPFAVRLPLLIALVAIAGLSLRADGR